MNIEYPIAKILIASILFVELGKMYYAGELAVCRRSGCIKYGRDQWEISAKLWMLQKNIKN